MPVILTLESRAAQVMAAHIPGAVLRENRAIEYPNDSGTLPILFEAAKAAFGRVLPRTLGFLNGAHVLFVYGYGSLWCAAGDSCPLLNNPAPQGWLLIAYGKARESGLPVSTWWNPETHEAIECHAGKTPNNYFSDSKMWEHVRRDYPHNWPNSEEFARWTADWREQIIPQWRAFHGLPDEFPRWSIDQRRQWLKANKGEVFAQGFEHWVKLQELRKTHISADWVIRSLKATVVKRNRNRVLLQCEWKGFTAHKWAHYSKAEETGKHLVAQVERQIRLKYGEWIPD